MRWYPRLPDPLPLRCTYFLHHPMVRSKCAMEPSRQPSYGPYEANIPSATGIRTCIPCGSTTLGSERWLAADARRRCGAAHRVQPKGREIFKVRFLKKAVPVRSELFISFCLAKDGAERVSACTSA